MLYFSSSINKRKIYDLGPNSCIDNIDYCSVKFVILKRSTDCTCSFAVFFMFSYWYFHNSTVILLLKALHFLWLVQHIYNFCHWYKNIPWKLVFIQACISFIQGLSKSEGRWQLILNPETTLEKLYLSGTRPSG